MTCPFSENCEMNEPYRLYGNLPSIWCEDSKRDNQYEECPMYEALLQLSEITIEQTDLVDELKKLLGENPKPKTLAEVLRETDQKIIEKLLLNKIINEVYILE